MFDIEIGSDAEDDLAAMRARDRVWVLDEIDRHLLHDPLEMTRRKKPLHGLVPPWDEGREPWELRVGDFRAFYDVDVKARVVKVHRIRRKPLHRTTEEIL